MSLYLKTLSWLPISLLLISWSGPWQFYPSADVSGKSKATVFVRQGTRSTGSGQVAIGAWDRNDFGVVIDTFRGYDSTYLYWKRLLSPVQSNRQGFRHSFELGFGSSTDSDDLEHDADLYLAQYNLSYRYRRIEPMFAIRGNVAAGTRHFSHDAYDPIFNTRNDHGQTVFYYLTSYGFSYWFRDDIAAFVNFTAFETHTGVASIGFNFRTR